MNWEKINLENENERNLDFLDAYNFKELLLEIECNIKDINAENVRKQAFDCLKDRYLEAKEIIDANLNNIVKYAKKERKNYK